ncbi:hypothetical protein KUTeg_011479 [Tegillarca granosa]|uniref:G-protein coupled receptors family 1 profile domain-containing protein n=1 Tax=Tegillarca granosa TaxID=220873 RepID=A0ABQ9F0N8_TEGGR|nr:hypothetical protein KUTeg_011479 [Tegillarca granosa]
MHIFYTKEETEWTITVPNKTKYLYRAKSSISKIFDIQDFVKLFGTYRKRHLRSCKIYSFCTALFSLVSINTLTAIALERYMVTMVPIFVTKVNKNSSCVIWIFIRLGYISIAWMGKLYFGGFIYKHFLCSFFTQNFFAESKWRMDLVSKIKQKKRKNLELETAKASLCIIILFCVAWMPYAVVCMIGIFGNASSIHPLLVSLNIANVFQLQPT